jgi:hypothetical protein
METENIKFKWDAQIQDGAELCSRFFQSYEACGLTFLSHQR